MAIPSFFHHFQSGLLDLVFPPRCVVCGTPGDLVCGFCMRDFPRIKDPVCRCCGDPVNNGRLCAVCRQAPPQLDGIRSVFSLEDGMRRAVHHFKYRNRPGLAAPLAGLMAEAWPGFGLDPDLVVPVPLHKNRLRERGYNQADLLAAAFGCIVNLPVASDALRRVRHTRAQVGLNAADRRSNVAGAFQTNSAGGYAVLTGKRVLLVDDVCTTGATLEACSMSLKAAGAVAVWGYTLARAA